MTPITIDLVRDLLAEKVLVGPKGLRQRLNMPQTTELGYLAVRLTTWRRQMRGMRDTATADKLRASIRGKLIEAAADIAELKTLSSPRDEAGCAALAQELEVYAWSKWLRPLCTWNDWRPYAAALGQEFVTAARPANPHMEAYGLGHSGPVARYVAAVLPLILTAKAPTVQTVSALMRADRAENPYRYAGYGKISVAPPLNQ